MTKEKEVASLSAHEGSSCPGEEIPGDFDAAGVALSLSNLKRLLPDREVVFFDAVDSTNRVGRELAASSFPDGSLVVARRQSGGRGRLGRSFASPRGGIYLSLVYHMEGRGEDALLITSAASVAAAEAIEEVTGFSCSIKWVNDLYFGGKKVAGILTEGVTDAESGMLKAVVVGIGINFCTPSSAFPPSLRSIAGSLYSGPSPVDPSRVVATLAEKLSFFKDNLADRAFLSEYRKRNMLLGRMVDLSRWGSSLEGGRVVGIDDEARLVIEKSDGRETRVGSGEVTVRLAQSRGNRYDGRRGKNHA